MDTLADLLEQPVAESPPPPGADVAEGRREPAEPVLQPWLRAQSINVARHTAALRPFQRAEFGNGTAAPTEGHIRAVNELIRSLRADLTKFSRGAVAAVNAAMAAPTIENLQRAVTRKEQAHDRVRAIERVWDFYFELFGQRQSRYADWLLSCDRIALDCYQYVYLGLGTSKSVPAPPPFAYMRTGFSPATFRRGVRLQRLGRQINPFPLVQLPYHRLINPWTLGAVLHEVSHNLHNDLGLERAVPHSIARRLLNAGLGRAVAATWVRWNRELYADLSGLLLGGPAIVASLMDVIGRAPATVMSFDERGVHPTPYIRAFISIELLRRLGFTAEAEQYRRAWTRLYPNPRAGNIPAAIIETMPRAVALVVDTVCFQPYETLGNKSLAQVIRFEVKEQRMIEEAARRLSTGTDPGVVPERFLIGAARIALDRGYARPGVIAENFFKDLARR